jgi:hypothetical protein
MPVEVQLVKLTLEIFIELPISALMPTLAFLILQYDVVK